MAEKKVLTNPDILNIILDYVGITIHKSCDSCGKVLKYQILNQQIEQSHITLCNKIYFCNNDCTYIYIKKFNEKKLYLFLILIIFGLSIWVIIILLNDGNMEITNFNLSI